MVIQLSLLVELYLHLYQTLYTYHVGHSSSYRWYLVELAFQAKIRFFHQFLKLLYHNSWFQQELYASHSNYSSIEEQVNL